MTFQEQETTCKFVAWGEKNAKDNSYVVKKDEALTGIIMDIKESGKYGFIFELKIKECDENLILTGNTTLKRGLGYETVTDKKTKLQVLKEKQSVAKPVVVGDKVRITFRGMLPSRQGEMYDFKIEVDR